MNDKRRSIGVFVFICIVLLFVIIGGIRFVKNREMAVAHNPAPVIETPKQEVEHQEQTKDNPPAQTNPQAPSTPAPTQPNTPAPQTHQTPAQVPATGPSYLDFGLTGILIMLTAYFAASLRRTRNTIKRMVLRY